MIEIEKMIKELCPDGVEYYPLNKLFNSFNGMTGVSNKWKEEGNCRFIEYMNAYKNIKIDINQLPYATVKSLKQNCLMKGDILLTSASETPDECAISSVIEDDIQDNIFLDDHLFGIRLKSGFEKNINASFVNYYMHSRMFRKSTNKTVRGVTRFYISVSDFMKICIPVPPYKVQEKIVEILDNFMKLSNALSMELEARKKQYEFYRDYYFDSILNEKKYLLGDVVEFLNGRAYKQEELLNEGKYKVLRVGNFGTNDRWYYSDLELEDNKYCNYGDLLYLWSASFGPQIWKDGKTIYHYHIWKIKHDEKLIDKRFLFYFFDYDKEKLQSLKTNSTMAHISMGNMKTREIYIPNMDKQREIAKKLDCIYELVNEKLPAEIEARKKQYDFYCNKLLTFKMIGDNS